MQNKLNYEKKMIKYKEQTYQTTKTKTVSLKWRKKDY